MGFVYIHTLPGRGACREPELPAAVCQGHWGHSWGHHRGHHQGCADPGVAPAFFIMIMIIIISIIIFSRHVHF